MAMLNVDELQDKEFMKGMADALEEYLYALEEYIVIDGITEEEYADSINTLKKLIKKLRKGDTSVYRDNLEEVVYEINEEYPF